MFINAKIMTIEDLAGVLNGLRTENRKIVHCHGVFDLLHIGHIRHFEEAKRLGDILVATITPDKYVNKGPHRPVFNEDLRAEAVAALDWVDYVAVNKWPMANEAIQLIRPDFYVKGSDYKDSGNDNTGGIKLEEQAVKSVGGQLAFTNGICFSSSNLINQNFAVFPKEVCEYLANFSDRYSTSDVLGYIDGAQKLKVLVVGESIIDEYQYCQAIGKSAKEPTLVVKSDSAEKFAGGILAAANHVANFCDQVGMITFLGSEESQEEFIQKNLNPKIERHLLYKNKSPTIVKRRFIESYFFTKLLEVYEINDEELDGENNQQLCEMLLELTPKYDVVIVIDYGHGMMSREAIDIVSNQASFLALNVQANASNLGYHTASSYPRANYISTAENEIRLETRDRHGDLKEMMLKVSERLSCDHIAITQGKFGCTVYKVDEGFYEIPAVAGQVVDRIGAGDAFLSITALCIAQQAPMEIVGFIGNAVGAQSVANVGHRLPVARVPLIKQVESLLK